MNLNQMIDHTLLKPNATFEELSKLYQEARDYHFKSVCINSTHIAEASEELAGSGVLICTVIDFPLGASTPKMKGDQTCTAVSLGADEVDMVIDITALKEGDYEKVREGISEVIKAAEQSLVKVIIETCLLSKEEIVRACQLAKEAGADFVKTSTGFSDGGATVKDIRLMRETVGSEMGVKASGGVRTFEDAQAMIEAGATRIGASASVEIIKSTKS